MKLAPRAFSLVEVLVTVSLLVTLAVPLYLMLISSTRSAAQAVEEVKATLLAEELEENLRNLSKTYHASIEHPLPEIPDWRYVCEHESPITGRSERWADLESALANEGVGTPLMPCTIETTRLFVQPTSDGFRRYFRIEHPRCYPDETKDPLIYRVRVLVLYERNVGGSATKTTPLELMTLLTLEDILAPLFSP